MRFEAIIKLLTVGAPLIGLAVVGLNACSNEAGDSTVAPEQRITQDITAVRARSATTLPAGGYATQPPPYREPSGPPPAFWPGPSPSSVDRALTSGNPQSGHDFAIGTCTPCHVVSPDQKSPFRFADAPDFRVIGNAPGTTAIGLNIWLTNPHPTMPKLVLHPQEAADVIAYILSLRQQR